jgi:hypothetical protein
MNSAASLGFLIAALPLQLAADVIFEKSPTLDSNFALVSKPEAQQTADYFTLSVSANISAVKWFGSFVPPASGQPHNYSIRFFKDVNGIPANTPLFQATVASPANFVSTPPGAFPIYSMQAVLPMPVTLAANERAWISILDLNATASSEFRWQESRSELRPRQWATRITESGLWVSPPDTGALAFTLEGLVVPEPSTTFLATLSLLVFSLFRRSAPTTRRKGKARVWRTAYWDSAGDTH